jgi:hypothetical protein
MNKKLIEILIYFYISSTLMASVKYSLDEWGESSTFTILKRYPRGYNEKQALSRIYIPPLPYLCPHMRYARPSR